MRDAVFSRAASVTRLTHPAAGHMLPLEDYDFCADAIDQFAELAA